MRVRARVFWPYLGGAASGLTWGGEASGLTWGGEASGLPGW